MKSKTNKRIQLRLRRFKLRGNTSMVFLHRPSVSFDGSFTESTVFQSAQTVLLQSRGESN